MPTTTTAPYEQTMTRDLHDADASLHHTGVHKKPGATHRVTGKLPQHEQPCHKPGGQCHTRARTSDSSATMQVSRTIPVNQAVPPPHRDTTKPVDIDRKGVEEGACTLSSHVKRDTWGQQVGSLTHKESCTVCHERAHALDYSVLADLEHSTIHPCPRLAPATYPGYA